MKTLLLRLAGPLQSWGTDSKFDIRKTNREPSKSGVVGLLAAALGRRRNESIDDLSALRFGVRVDREGTLLHDYHMVHKDEKTSYVTHRYYLSDAVFLVGLESEDEAFLAELAEALRRPVFQLFLGRRSCPPTLPLMLGIREGTLEQVLAVEAPLTGKDGLLRRQIEVPIRSNSGRLRDVPVSFSSEARSYALRGVRTDTVRFGSESTEHDPMAELGG